MIQSQTDDNWLLLSLGLAAMIVQLGFSFVCAAVLLMGDVPAAGGPGVGFIVAFFALTFALNIILIFVHEMGHAVAAWSVGRRVHLICVGIVGYAPDTGRFMHVVKPDNAEYAGFVQASPVWPDLSHSKSIWISLGGPLATGGLGVVIFLVGTLIGAPRLAVLFLTGFFVMDAVVNLIPLTWVRGGGSDGLHILEYLSGKGWTPDMWADTRLAMAELSPDLVSDAEWAELQALKNGPFTSEPMNKLIEAAGKQRP